MNFDFNKTHRKMLELAGYFSATDRLAEEEAVGRALELARQQGHCDACQQAAEQIEHFASHIRRLKA